MTDFYRSRVAGGVLMLAVVGCAAIFLTEVRAQTIDTSASRRTLDDAVGDNCEGVSVVVQRCARKPMAAPATSDDDALAKSRAAAKAAFDRRDRRSRDEAMDAQTPSPGTAPAGDAQKLGGVTVTGRPADVPPPPEQVLQRALAPPKPATGPTVVHDAPNGTRYECIEKCFGPACCVELRSIPNPARDLNSIGR